MGHYKGFSYTICRQKKYFETKGLAYKFIRTDLSNRQDTYAYHCRECNGFHLATSKDGIRRKSKSQKNKERIRRHKKEKFYRDIYLMMLQLQEKKNQ